MFKVIDIIQLIHDLQFKLTKTHIYIFYFNHMVDYVQCFYNIFNVLSSRKEI